MKYREVFFYGNHFESFFAQQRLPVKDKIKKTILRIEESERIPNHILKSITGAKGLFEIRVDVVNDIFRIFCFFDKGKIIVLANGFQKKTQKTPQSEIIKALKIKQEYEESK